MKTRHLLLLTSLMMVVSCAQDRILDLQQDAAIEFRPVIEHQTRATGYSASNLTSINVTAMTGDAYYIKEVDFRIGDNGLFASDDKYRWPESGTLDFYGYAPNATWAGDVEGNGLKRNGELSYTVKPLADTDNQIDFIYAKGTGSKDANAKSGVTLNFRHVMSQIKVKVKNTNPSLKFVVTGWKIAQVDGLATFSFGSNLTTDNTVLSRDMWADNNGQDVTYVKAIDADTVTGTNTTWGELNGSAILIPQATTGAANYAGNVPDGSYIAVEMECMNAANSEVVFAKQWCCWPVSYDWEPGYRYNYTLDLSEGGYKETGTGSLDPTLQNAEVMFVDIKVDNWQPDDGMDIIPSMGDTINTQPTPPSPVVHYDNPCLRFHTENGTQTLYLNKGGDVDDTKLIYSVDEGQTWDSLLFRNGTANGILFGYDGTENHDLLLRGNSGFSNNTADNQSLIMNYFSFADPTQLVDCTGSVGSLTDYDNPSAPLFNTGQYYCLFMYCGGLRTAPDLTATELTENCYGGMFVGCTDLVTPMANLPATILKYDCYDNMFRECSSLMSAPSISATTLANKCCAQMFHGCTSLVEAPELPVTTMAPSCYAAMFYGCTSLQSTPALPATQLEDGCYMYMFEKCSSLKTVQGLPATNMVIRCYKGMFEECTSLETAPVIPATHMVRYCFEEMFMGCTGLTTVPDLPAASMADSCCVKMFKGCTSLSVAPNMPATVLSELCYERMFEGCTNLTTVPCLPAPILSNKCYHEMFKGCTSLNSIKAMFVNAQPAYCDGWLDGVATVGTFTRNAAATWNVSDYIPDGWNVLTATE